jgi:hypothetical protein
MTTELKKILINDDEKDDDGDSKNSDSDDDGDSLKDKVKKLLS